MSEKLTFIKTNKDRDGRWHSAKKKLPDPYWDIIIVTNKGRILDGYVTGHNQFIPHPLNDTEGMIEVRVKKWRYGQIEQNPDWK